ncbi:MAG: SAM-dependent methyltransferase [Patulibacter minatonensis]
MTDRELLAEYDRWFRDDPDPWRFTLSPYEQAKRAATVAACGPEGGRTVLELGAANGVLAADLAPLARRLVAVEAAPSAAALARERLAPLAGCDVIEGLVPQHVPAGPFDLIVASEILYYLDDPSYARTLAALPEWLAPGGRVVAVHWRPAGPERPRAAADVHADLAALPTLRVAHEAPTDEYLLTVLDAVT